VAQDDGSIERPEKLWRFNMEAEPIIKGKVAFDYHRNGISGLGFYSARFSSDTDGGELEPFVAILEAFDLDDPFERGHCYVLAVKDLLDSGPVRNWRGDNFEDELRPLLALAWQVWRQRIEANEYPFWPIIVGEDGGD